METLHLNARAPRLYPNGTAITKLITAAHTPRYLRIAVVVTFDVARFAFNLPARLWLSWNLTSQAISQNFMMYSYFSFLSDQHCLVAPNFSTLLCAYMGVMSTSACLCGVGWQDDGLCDAYTPLLDASALPPTQA